MAEKVSAADGERSTRIAAMQHQRVRRHVDLLFAKKNAAAGLVGVRGKNMPVGARAGQADEHGIFDRFARIVSDIRNIDLAVKRRRHFYAGKDLF